MPLLVYVAKALDACPPPARSRVAGNPIAGLSF
jgi:hypothetical protein